MEMEVARLAGADRYERTGDRASYRNGYRGRRFDTRVGTLEVEILKAAHRAELHAELPRGQKA
jgi:putative transposase